MEDATDREGTGSFAEESPTEVLIKNLTRLRDALGLFLGISYQLRFFDDSTQSAGWPESLFDRISGNDPYSTLSNRFLDEFSRLRVSHNVILSIPNYEEEIMALSFNDLSFFEDMDEDLLRDFPNSFKYFERTDLLPKHWRLLVESLETPLREAIVVAQVIMGTEDTVVEEANIIDGNVVRSNGSTSNRASSAASEIHSDVFKIVNDLAICREKQLMGRWGCSAMFLLAISDLLIKRISEVTTIVKTD
ncbi:hypothetical protein [Roseobacter litoralis]|uniref:Uncharacterized protein n=1 Tax=Roseobacter litoralis (strain ATCC 49566 / DSM 6996 / JCM 21268 / NBRC 15278 / OCh 149) TaxID=391595 RepID=F7ZF38_ROSLO|nr:hypothetical protein [Roseobacter litoralis]AEI93469.1 hypothetical protein RLO149_c014720 [Roseobacter litoralis Och 149]